MISTKKRLLIIDDNIDIRDIMSIHFESKGYEVFQANDGSEGLEVLQKTSKFECIICDLQMPKITGVMFLKIIRDKNIHTPLIFITGFDKILDSVEAHKLGAQGFLLKPFSHDELEEKIVEVALFKKIVSRSEAEVKLDDYYSRIHIDEFVTGKKILYPVFLKISDAKFIKIAHTGEDLEVSKIENLKRNGIEHFYLENEDFKNYLRRNIHMAKGLLNFKGISDSKKREFFVSITKNLMEYEFTREIDSEILSLSISTIQNTLRVVAKKKNFFKVLQDLNSSSPSLGAHSVLVSLLASAIALESKNFNHKTVTLVSLAGLYHDFGLKEFPVSLIDKISTDNFTDEERAAYQTHSQLGSQILLSIKGMPEMVAEAVLHHHEHCDGSGFPFGIGRIKINPIARILAIADYVALHYSLAGKDADFRRIVLQLKDMDDIFDKDLIKATLNLVNTNDPILKVMF